MKIGKRRAILGIAGLLASFAAFVPSTASASCTVIIEDGGCIENAISAAFRPLNPDCIQ